MSSVSWLAHPGLQVSGTQLAARAPQLTVWVLSALLGIQAAVIVTHLAGSSAGHSPRAAAVTTGPLRAPLNLAALQNGHIFGVPPPPPPVDDANAPRTSMPLVLTGIISATDPKNGIAIIGTSPSATRLYAVGERVPGNARVHAVYSDRVLLERNGTIEALMLPQKFTGTVSARPPIVGPSALDRVQRAISNEPGLISDVLRPQPVFAEGKLRGYRVYPGQNVKAFGMLGLRNGDLVTAVNGTALDDPARGNDIFSSLGNSDQARVTVMRNGQQQDITLNMSQIATQAEQLSNGADQNPSGGAEPAAGQPADQAPYGPGPGPRNPRDNR